LSVHNEHVWCSSFERDLKIKTSTSHQSSQTRNCRFTQYTWWYVQFFCLITRFHEFSNSQCNMFLPSLIGIQFLPVNKNVYLKIQSFLNCLEHTFDPIRYTSFMYKNQLVWSGLEQEEMKILYKFVVLFREQFLYRFDLFSLLSVTFLFFDRTRDVHKESRGPLSLVLLYCKYCWQ
jgi:hypothetical protein